MPYGKRVIRYMPAQKMGKTRQLLAKSAREPSESGSITRDESTQKVLKTKEMLIKESSMLAGRIDAIRAIGNLKTAPIAAMAIRRMQALAEAARKVNHVFCRRIFLFLVEVRNVYTYFLDYMTPAYRIAMPLSA